MRRERGGGGGGQRGRFVDRLAVVQGQLLLWAARLCGMEGGDGGSGGDGRWEVGEEGVGMGRLVRG